MRVVNIDKCQFETVLRISAVMLLQLATIGSVASAQPAIRWEPFVLEARDGRVEGAELGRLSVPERHASPERTIEIAFVRLKTTNANPGAPVVYLDGGPGGPGYTFVRVPAYLALVEAIRATRDVILLSQRGIGLSHPVPSCPAEGPLPADVFLSVESMARALEPRTRACAEMWRAKGIDLAAYNTAESADDVEDLRKALGVPRIALLGFSYGAHLGLSVIRRHPPSIECAILAGVEGPSHTWKLPSTFDTQFEKLSQLTGVDFGTVWRTVLGRAAKEPLHVTINIDGSPRELPIGPAALQYFVRRDIGDTNDWAWIPTFITQLSRGDTTLLTRIAGGTYQGLGSGIRLMPLAMDCASGATEARLARIRAEEPRSALGLMTNFPFPFVCGVLNVPMLPDSFRQPVRSDVPALFISGTLDANAPAAQADEVAAGFSKATSLLVENAGHESTLPLPAVQAAIVAFLQGTNIGPLRLTASSSDRTQATTILKKQAGNR